MTVFALLGSEASAQDVTRVGHFASVRVSVATGDAHCYGHSLTLWEHRGRLIGLLDVHQGLCVDPPCYIELLHLRETGDSRAGSRLDHHVLVGGVGAEP
jgi:hypothetical protein